MSLKTRDCERLQTIALRRAEGLFVGPDDVRFAQRHLCNCDSCGVESTVLGALAADHTAGPAQPLDELTSRRLADDIVARADELIFNGEDNLFGTDEKSDSSKWLGALAVAAVVLMAVGAAFLFAQPDNSQPISQVAKQITLPITTQTAPSPLVEPDPISGQCILLSGNAQIDSDQIAIGDKLEIGQQLDTNEGRAVLSLPTGIVLSLSPDTKLGLEQSDPSVLEVVLAKGELLASVDPGRSGPKLVILTRDGNVEVTGTVFSVSANAEDVKVRVLRGKVKITDGEQIVRNLETGNGLIMGTGESRVLASREENALWQDIKLFELLSPENNNVVDIGSFPQGIDVVIDGIIMGKTPLKASIRTGHRNMALVMNNHEMVRELINIGTHEQLSRIFDFTQKNSSSMAKTNRQTAPKMLLEAQSLRAEGNWSAAAQVYQRLIKLHPSTNESHVSLVSLGVIKLEKLGDPNRASKLFSRYLSLGKRGVLEQEAMFGIARSYKSLGRTNEERQILEKFLTRFPSAIQANQAKRRLEQLQ